MAYLLHGSRDQRKNVQYITYYLEFVVKRIQCKKKSNKHNIYIVNLELTSSCLPTFLLFMFNVSIPSCTFSQGTKRFIHTETLKQHQPCHEGDPLACETPQWESVIYGRIMYSSNLLSRSCSEGSDLDRHSWTITPRRAVNILYMYLYYSFSSQACLKK